MIGWLFIGGAIAYVVIGSAVYQRFHDRLAWKRAREIHWWRCPRKLVACGRHDQIETPNGAHLDQPTKDCKECRELGFQHCHPCFGDRAVQARELFAIVGAILWVVMVPIALGLRIGKPRITRSTQLQLRISEMEKAIGIGDTE